MNAERPPSRPSSRMCVTPAARATLTAARILAAPMCEYRHGLPRPVVQLREHRFSSFRRAWLAPYTGLLQFRSLKRRCSPLPQVGSSHMSNPRLRRHGGGVSCRPGPRRV